MDETIRNPEVELNEAELKAVGGGSAIDPNAARLQANDLCNMCHHTGHAKCGCMMDLADYILKNGRIPLPQNCPYY